MKRVLLPGLFLLVVLGSVCGSPLSAQAQWGYEVPVFYSPVVTYRPIIVPQPVVVAQPVVFRRPVVAYSVPYAYGGYGYVAGPRVVRDRYNYGAFGHLNHHHHEHGGGWGHSHYHARYPYGW